jgi:hypothetical protein
MAAVTSAVDRIRFVADPDPDSLSILMPILNRILQYGTYGTSSLHCVIFLISVIGVIIFSILDSIPILTFSRKKDSLFSHLIETNTDPETIPIRIRKNDANPTGSGFE